MWISYTDGYVNSDKLVTIFVVKKDNGKWAVLGGFEGDEFVTFDTYDNKVLAERQADRIARTLNGQPIEETDIPLSKPEEPKKSKYDTNNPRVKCIKITDDDDIEKMAKMICDALGL